MTGGDLEPVRGAQDLYCHDTGMFDVDGYGAVYVYDTPKPAVIDTGIGTNRDLLFDALGSLGIESGDLAWILPTHAHLDHAGGAGYLAAEYPNATVRIHERAVPHLIDPERLVEATKAVVEDQWRHYAEPRPVPDGRIAGLANGDAIDLGDRTLGVVEAPGHAPHQTMFHEPDGGVLFTGDAAGVYVPAIDDVRPTTPPPQFDFDVSLDDVRKVADLDPDILCFGHFGPRTYDPAIVGAIKRTYVEWVEAVRRKRDRLGDDEAVVEHFEETTEMAPYWNEERARADASLNARGVMSYLDRVDGA